MSGPRDPLEDTALGDWPADADGRPPVERPAPPFRRGRSPGDRLWLGVLLGVLVAVALALGAAAGWFLTRDESRAEAAAPSRQPRNVSAPPAAPSQRVEVPKLVGLSRRRALALLERKGLRARVEVEATIWPNGAIVAQSPPAGTLIARGRHVEIVVDRGARGVAVPDVRGQTLTAGRTKLERAGFRVRVELVSSPRPSGTVVAQAPAPTKTLPKGGVVVLTVARPAVVVTPNLVGKSLDDALAVLRSAGLEATVVGTPSADRDGKVTGQQPRAGTRIAEGAQVRISVASARRTTPTGTTTAGTTTTGTTTATTTAPARTAPPPRVAVPDVSGLLVQAAAQRIAEGGLLVSIQYVPSEEPLGTVVAQFPAAESTAPRLAHVTVNAARGPGEKEDETVPNLVGQTLDAAVAAANAAGLRLFYLKRQVPTQAQAGTIVEQTPRAGAAAPHNAQLLVYLGAYRAP